MHAAKPLHKCLDDKGHAVYSDVPCPVVAVPPRPPAAPPCALTATQRRNAERLEGQFLLRYPDEDKHRAVSVAGLREVVARIRFAEGRLSDLRRERKSIDDELAFYEHRPVPPELKRRLDANEARFAAIADVFLGIENEIKTIVTRYECERRQFGFLWHGGAPGSSACAAACKASD
ncbi:MAG: hypothetical protein ACXWIG_02220 [Caldimonas sp.]